MLACWSPVKANEPIPPNMAKGPISSGNDKTQDVVVAIFGDPSLRKSILSLVKEGGEFLSKPAVSKVATDIAKVAFGVPFVGIGVQALAIIINNVATIEENNQKAKKVLAHAAFLQDNLKEIVNEELQNEAIISLLQSAWILEENTKNRKGCAKGFWTCAKSFICAQSIASTLEYVRLELQQIQLNVNTLLLTQANRRQPHFARGGKLAYDSYFQKVGLQSRIDHIMKRLEQSQPVNRLQTVGVHGIGGIGKSTLLSGLRAHIASISSDYIVASKVFNDSSSEQNIQEDLYTQLTGINLIFRDQAEGQNHLASVLKDFKENNKKVCFIFDNLQLQRGESNIDIGNILPESAIINSNVTYLIVSAREKQVVQKACLLYSSQVEDIILYEPSLLNENEAIDLFCKKANIDMHAPSSSHEKNVQELIGNIVPLLGGLPLAVEVYGSFFKDKDKQLPGKWRNVVDKLNNAQDPVDTEQEKVFKKLELSLDLYDQNQQIKLTDFMDAALFWKDKPWEDAKLALLWEGDEDGLHNLEEKSLVSSPSNYDNLLHMHDILFNVAQNKARAGHHVYHTITPDTSMLVPTIGNQEEKIRGLSYKEAGVSTSILQKMDSLKFLNIEGGQIVTSTNILPQEMKAYPKWLIYIFFVYFSLMIPIVSYALAQSIMNPYLFLVLLAPILILLIHFLYSHILPSTMINAMGGQILPKSLTCLTIYNCYNTIALSNSIGKLTQLRSLDLSKNHGFKKNLSSSIFSNLAKLHLLKFSKCPDLTKLPNSLSKLSSLRTLDLSFCSVLEELPSCLGELTTLEILDISNCQSLFALPNSLGDLTHLHTINISNCDELSSLPSTFGRLASLHTLELSKSDKIAKLPTSFTMLHALKNLYMSGCSGLKNLPKKFGDLTSLTHVDISRCSSLLGLPTSIGNLKSLQFLDASHCNSLHEVAPNLFDPLQNSLEYLDLTACPKFNMGSHFVDMAKSLPKQSIWKYKNQ